MSSVITCRSPQAIRDDLLVEAHTDLGRLLNETCNGVCLYRGAQRERIVALRAQVEAEILGAGHAPQLLRAHIYAVVRA